MTVLASFPLTVLSATLTAGFVAGGLVAAAYGLYLLVLSCAVPFCPARGGGGSPRTRLVVIVPAHNEFTGVARCVRSLRDQTYPRDLYEIVVVADNCTDETATVASAAGADRVIVRNVPDLRGKGYALRWALDRLLAVDSAASAIVVVDADSIADSKFLAALVEPFEAGAQSVQGESLLYGDGSHRAALRVAAFLLMNRVRPLGRAALNMPARLSGNGMLIARDVLKAKPWEAFTTVEDVEYSLALRIDGISAAFARGAVLLSATAPNSRAAAQQELRWQGGKIHIVRRWVPRLLRRGIRERSLSLLVAAFEIAIPPLGFLAFESLAGAGLVLAAASAGLVPTWAAIPWLFTLAAIPLHVLIGLRSAGAPKSTYVALVRAPLYILGTALRARRVASFRGDTWVRTERGEQGSREDTNSLVAPGSPTL